MVTFLGPEKGGKMDICTEFPEPPFPSAILPSGGSLSDRKSRRARKSQEQK
jgi:hypothetical protein